MLLVYVSGLGICWTFAAQQIQSVEEVLQRIKADHLGRFEPARRDELLAPIQSLLLRYRDEVPEVLPEAMQIVTGNFGLDHLARAIDKSPHLIERDPRAALLALPDEYYDELYRAIVELSTDTLEAGLAWIPPGDQEAALAASQVTQLARLARNLLSERLLGDQAEGGYIESYVNVSEKALLHNIASRFSPIKRPLDADSFARVVQDLEIRLESMEPVQIPTPLEDGAGGPDVDDRHSRIGAMVQIVQDAYGELTYYSSPKGFSAGRRVQFLLHDRAVDLLREAKERNPWVVKEWDREQKQRIYDSIKALYASLPAPTRRVPSAEASHRSEERSVRGPARSPGPESSNPPVDIEISWWESWPIPTFIVAALLVGTLVTVQALRRR
jgi:hypothetical protein